MIVTTDPDVTRKVFSYNDPDTLLMGVGLFCISCKKSVLLRRCSLLSKWFYDCINTCLTTATPMQVHPSGKNILGDGNLAFMHGPPHKAIRKSFLSLFTRKALSTYVELQDGIIRSHITKWLQTEGEREIRLDIRCAIFLLLSLREFLNCPAHCPCVPELRPL